MLADQTYYSGTSTPNRQPPGGKGVRDSDTNALSGLGVLCTLKMLQNKAAPPQDAGVTARRQLEFRTWRAVCRLTQVLEGRGAKKGELRWASRARAGRGRCRGVSAFATLQLLPPPGAQHDDAHGCWSVSADEWGV